MVSRFLASGRSGFYVAVIHEGEVGAGDEFAMLRHDPNSVSVSEITRLYLAKKYGPRQLRQVRRAIATDALPDSWKDYFEEKLHRLDA
jgi:MOSC domain-containing protein YiiM